MKPRPEVVSGTTSRIKTGCGYLYVTINNDRGEVFEVFATMGKAGGCACSQAECIGRLLSEIARSGGDIARAARQIKGISCHQPAKGFAISCADGIGKLLEKEIENLTVKKVCPEPEPEPAEEED